HGMAAMPAPAADLAGAAGMAAGSAGVAGTLGAAAGAVAASAAGVHVAGLLVLIAVTSAAALLMKRFGLPNAWGIGPLLLTALLTASGVHLSSVPEWMVRAGQLAIGISLGTRFAPEFLRAVPRFMASVAICNVVAMSCAACFAALLAWAAGIHGGTAV